MASACIHEQNLGKVIKYLHPNKVLHKKAAITNFPSYHRYRYRNKNGTRKKIYYDRGEHCLIPVHTFCWKPLKKILKKSFQVLSNKILKKLL